MGGTQRMDSRQMGTLRSVPNPGRALILDSHEKKEWFGYLALGFTVLFVGYAEAFIERIERRHAMR